MEISSHIVEPSEKIIKLNLSLTESEAANLRNALADGISSGGNGNGIAIEIRNYLYQRHGIRE